MSLLGNGQTLIQESIACLKQCVALIEKLKEPIEPEIPLENRLNECCSLLEGSIIIEQYKDESQMDEIMQVIKKDLSEPYSIYTYRYFIHNWLDLCLLALDAQTKSCVGVIICKMDVEPYWRGYIAMLAVDASCRRKGIGTQLVKEAIKVMKKTGCVEVSLETEVTNQIALNLYSGLAFIREKRLFQYYLNGIDAYRLKLQLKEL